MDTKLTRITEVAKQKPKEKFTSLVHLINEESLKKSHQEMDGKRAVGVDGVTKEKYGKQLGENLTDLVQRMKRQAYRPQAVRRVYIEKAGSHKKRPLGIVAYEDKLVQAVMADVLNAIYEPEFLNHSFGFRPGRGPHDALKALNDILYFQPINVIVDVDIRGFFDHVDHNWMMKFLEHRIADPNFLRLIRRFLKAGIMEGNVMYETDEGTIQGGNISPILANIYLHYVIDLWYEKRIRKQCRGQALMVRFADDLVFCFQKEEEAREFYKELCQRLKDFGLEIAEEKTKILTFGREAYKAYQEEKKDKDKDKGQGPRKPGTFDFLGFTHYCSTGRNGRFRIKRKTSNKKYRASLAKVKNWIQKQRHLPKKILMEMLGVKLRGYYQYYGVLDNSRMLEKFSDKTKQYLFKYLNRRSQRKSLTWEGFNLLLRMVPLPRPRIYHKLTQIKPNIGVLW